VGLNRNTKIVLATNYAKKGGKILIDWLRRKVMGFCMLRKIG